MRNFKKCYRCGLTKVLEDYYKYSSMRDGYLNKCKQCVKDDARKREQELKSTPEGLEKERKRHREKYHRLNYKDKHKPSFDRKKITILKYNRQYPEKKKAKCCSQHMTKDGLEIHHWSYNKIHWKDILYLTNKEHAKAHRFIIYDQELMMYRRFDNNELLDTKQKHEEFIRWCINNKED